MFPVMKNLTQPYNVSFQPFVLQPFPQVHFNKTSSGGFVEAVLTAKVDALLPNLTQGKPIASVNVHGRIALEIIPQVRGLRAYIAGYDLLDITSPDGTADVESSMEFLDVMGQGGFDYANSVLASKVKIKRSIFNVKVSATWSLLVYEFQ